MSAGHSVHSAINAVGQVDDGVVGTALARAWQRFCDGSTLADELRALPGLVGEQVRPLCSTLILAMSSGAPLEPALLRLADRERRRVRRRVEQRVRKLPVLMLAPLVTLLLPSFTVLSILPVVLSTAAEANF
ncbi:MAG: type II secretion system F family protein [Microthrixaceae bacterium]|nr:type II secretion system F family protein [Microthrixaceae bacterium]